MFDDKLDLYIVTTNGFVAGLKGKGRPHLVMGRGAALMATKLAPDLPYAAAVVTQTVFDYVNSCRVYGFVEIDDNCIDGVIRRFGFFQVKYHWQDKADLALIGFSILSLNKWLRFHASNLRNVGMNYPGIGNGGLTKDQVAPLLESLDKRVVVYEL